MIILLSIVALVEFIWIVYQDFKFSRERERYHLKLMSRDVGEYQAAVEEPPKDTIVKKDPYVDIQDVPVEKLMDAEDNL